MIHDFGGGDLFSLSGEMYDVYDIYDTELGELTNASIELDCLNKDSWRKRWTNTWSIHDSDYSRQRIIDGINEGEIVFEADTREEIDKFLLDLAFIEELKK